MKILHLVIAMLFGAFGTSKAAIIRLEFYSTVSSSRPSATSPVSPGMEAKLVIAYDSDQPEDSDVLAGDPVFDGISNASSSYTVLNYSASLTVGSHTWISNNYIIEVGNDVPFVTPQDYFKVRFTAAAPAEFVMLGFNEVIDIFNLDIRDFGSLNSGVINFLVSTSSPTPTSIFNLEDVDFGNSTIKGDTIPTNWYSIVLRPRIGSILLSTIKL